MNPELLLLDEPSERLSPLAVGPVVEVIEHLRQAELPMLLVEQNLSLALKLADYVYVMNKGTVVFEGSAAELGNSTNTTHLSRAVITQYLPRAIPRLRHCKSLRGVAT